MYKDIQSFTDSVPALHPVSSAAARDGVIVDRKGAQAHNFEIFAGALDAGLDGTDKYTFALTHGDVVDDEAAPTSITDSAAVPAADLVVDGVPGGTLPEVDDQALQNGRIARVGYRGYKRYVLLSVVDPGAAGASILYAICVKGSLEINPPA